MANLKLVGGELNLTKVYRDGLSLDLDFSISLVGYTFVASVVNAVTKVETAITVTSLDLSNGKLKLTMTPEVAAAIPVGKHTWSLSWTPPDGLKRTVLAGTFEVVA